jgi:ribonuclease PH
MAQTTFSGPVKAGTISQTTGTAVGTNVANVGFVVMGQSAVIDIIGASAADQVVATIPAGSQIIDVILNVTTANDDTGTATVVVGTSADADAFIPSTSVKSVGTTRGTLDTEATDVGTTDIQVLADFTAQNGNGAAGAATVTVLYLQARDLV